MSEKWTEELDSRLTDMLNSSKKPTSVLPVAGVTPNNNNNTLLLFAVVAFMVVGLFLVYKKNQSQSWASNQWQAQSQQSWPNSQPYSQQQQGTPNWNNPWQSTDPLAQQVEKLQAQYENLDAAAKKIWERTKWNSDHMTLLATVNNHNLVVMQQNLPRSELIFINEDFTINRMPDRIKLDVNDQEFIRRFIRR